MRTPDRTTTWADLARRTDAFGAALVEAGIVAPPVAAAAPTEPWRCPNPQVALYMHNHPAYLEAMVGAWKARATGMNVNYRYRATELVDLLNDAEPEAVVYHQAFTPTLSEALPRLAHRPRLILRVPDDSGHPPARGARLRGGARRRRGAARRGACGLEPRGPLCGVHRRHDRHAQGGAVAPE